MKKKIEPKRIICVGDDFGISQLLEYVPHELVVGFIVASIRPQYIEYLSSVARNLNKKIFIQPRHNTIEYNNFISQVEQSNPDLILCHSYSMLLRNELINMVSGNAMNIHASLLPKNRGPHPIQWAIIHGENKTGVTLHYMNENFDAGNIIDQIEVSISIDDTWLTLREKISKIYPEFLKKNIPKILTGNFCSFPQDEKLATKNKRISNADIKVDFDGLSTMQLYNLIRSQVAPLGGVEISKGEKSFVVDKFLPLAEVGKFKEII